MEPANHVLSVRDQRRFMSGVISCLIATLLLSISLPVVADTVVMRDLKELNSFFKRKGYAVEEWKKGEQKIPRLIILDIPETWRKEVAPELTVDEKKETFFRFAIPLAFMANELVIKDRKRIEALKGKYGAASDMPTPESDWLHAQAVKYGVAPGPIDDKALDELLLRVDIVPPSLVVAQMADESGWGTSRFAAEGNALFGQWSYSGGIKPEHQRASKGDYRIKAFKTPLASVQAYMENLNSSKAYSDFRKKRAQLREQASLIKGSELVGTLIDYSERREAYVREIRGLIKDNNLDPLDASGLASGETVYVRLGGPTS